MENSKKSLIGIIFVIILVAAGLVYYKTHDNPETQTASLGQFSATPEHSLGNPNAELAIEIFFDPNCFHCRNLHQTMHQIIDEYGKDGKLKWVSKYLPLNEVSQRELEVTECVSSVAGEGAYWQFLDKLMMETIDPLNSKEEFTNSLVEMAGAMNIDEEKLAQCVLENPYEEKINQNRQEAIELGAEGTPLMVFRKNGEIFTIIPGALPYEDLKAFLEERTK